MMLMMQERERTNGKKALKSHSQTSLTKLSLSSTLGSLHPLVKGVQTNRVITEVRQASPDQQAADRKKLISYRSLDLILHPSPNPPITLCSPNT